MHTKMFIHGLESNNKGTKSVFFRERYPDMIIPHFTGALQERMKKLRKLLEDKRNIRLVGSSFGGLMASLFAFDNEGKIEKMILLAPAINLMEFAPQKNKKINVPVWIYHGKADKVIPLSDVKRVAEETFVNLSFHGVDDDHFLHNTFRNIDWDKHLA
jgi:pimeloyl-ACP methyl ester carboxylesterase